VRVQDDQDVRQADDPAGDDRPPERYDDDQRGPRLQVVLARAGVASRRAAEQLVLDGAVTVNGMTVTELPAWVNPQRDRVCVDGRPIQRPPRPRKREPSSGDGRVRQETRAGAGTTTLMVYKPRGVISTNDDPEGRTRVIDLVDTPADVPGGRLFPIGRLDIDSGGLILLTNDGELANRLTHPRYEVPKHYRVTVRGRPDEKVIQKLQRGLYLANRRPDRSPDAPAAKRAAMDRVRILRTDTDRRRQMRTHLAVTLTEGQNREVRRLLARLGHPVHRLQRVGIGPLRLKGLQVGQWRRLTAGEMRGLRKAAGLR
jgi:pseudouridine synthase